VTRLAFDTLGIGTLLRDYTVETSLRALDARTTQVAMSHFYATPTWRSRRNECERGTAHENLQHLLHLL